MNKIIFAALLIPEIIVLAYIIKSYFSPSLRIWPPPNNNQTINYVLMLSTYVFFFGVIYLSVLEVGSDYLHFPGIRIAGTVIFISGLSLYIWCRVYFSKKLEFGFTEKLITSGPYRHMRNPIYIADVLIALGFALFSDSLFVYIVLLLFSVILILLPLIEEPWLSKQYGDDYLRYFSQVPRFIPNIRKDRLDL